MASSTHHVPAREAATGGDEPKAIPTRPPSRRRAKSVTPPRTGPQEIIVLGAGPAARLLYSPALRALQASHALVVRAIVDSSERARESWAEDFPLAARIASLEGVVTAPDALVIVATPTRFHAGQANTALKRGWHVFCATPFASTAHDAALMIAAAQRYERLLAVDLRPRFFPSARYLRTLCHDHLLGPPLSFRVHVGQPRVPASLGTVHGDKFEHPDGVLTDLGVHSLDLLTWCLGSASIISYADDAMGGVEANASIELSFGEGVRGTVHLSRDWPTEDAYTFVFERGIVRWAADRPNGLTLHLASAPSAVSGELVTPLSPVHHRPSEPLLATADEACIVQLQNVLSTIAGRETLRSPATEAMHALPLIEECYARRTPLPQPWLTRVEVPHARALCPPAALRRP
jgi:predicted dehydrogenase